MLTRHKVLLLGNGINLLYGDQSWEMMIRNELDRSNNGLTWEKIESVPATMQIVLATDDKVDSRLKGISGELEKQQITEDRATFLRELVGLPVDCVLTANYSLEIERALGFSGSCASYRSRLKRTIKPEGIRDEFKYEAGSGNTAEKKESKVYKKLKDLEGSTIHRLLKYSRSNNGFSYNAKEQFSEKSIFVIDEASMIDINLFASLLQAIPEGAKIFILGDPYQLPSVDAGAVLGEILKPRSKKDFTVRLTKSNRFTDDSVIGNLAKEIKACAENGNAMATPAFAPHPALDSTVAPDAPAKNSGTEVPAQSENLPKDAVFYYSLPAGPQTKKQETETLEKILHSWMGDFYKLPQMALEINPENPDKGKCEAIWELSLKKRILSAERRGIYGVEQINMSAGKLIRDYGAKKFSDRYFPGELLMITQNQAMYKLYNGDTGIVVYKDSTPYIMLKKASENETGFVFYPLSWFPTDAIEPAFAITIHKSQGSEYNHVTMFLPRQEGHPLLNNQILYTGITRAKHSVTIIATPETFKVACETVIERDTGIEL